MMRYRICFALINLGLSLMPKHLRSHTFIHNCILTGKIKADKDLQKGPTV
ncbi:hypothetical protein NVP1198B_22 [Vibrio phage 1.198.B._10N.286.54.F4]|nr:hypothetical protein NVP1198A_22 [Vibrio phage 1.198.A._10N.286.54.F4]AUR94810.1 hypothetical protein NVP1198B_22 [Vibrio phage 1.198.B._10N.286.54.F4]